MGLEVVLCAWELYLLRRRGCVASWRTCDNNYYRHGNHHNSYGDGRERPSGTVGRLPTVVREVKI